MKECSLVLLEGRVEVPDCSVLKDILRIAFLFRNKSICELTASISAEALRRLLFLSRRAKSKHINLPAWMLSTVCSNNFD